MKKGSFRIRINQPCNEDWNAMTPEDRGRFCASCQKSVTDFSAFTDKEIFNYVQQHQGQKLCGRFSQQQLSRELHSEYRQGSYTSMLRVAASIFLGALGSLSAAGQVSDSTSIENAISQSPKPARQVHIKGQVTSPEKGEAIAGAKISIPGLDSAISDSSGYFELNVLTSLDSIELLTDAKGWESQRNQVQLSHLLLDHCSAIEKNLRLTQDTQEFQWELLPVDSLKINEPLFNTSSVESVTDFFGNFTVGPSSKCKASNSNGIPPQKLHARTPWRTFSPYSSLPESNFEFSEKELPQDGPRASFRQTQGSITGPINDAPTPEVPLHDLPNHEAIFPTTQNENEEQTEDAE